MVEFSPATREARVRFPDIAFFLFIFYPIFRLFCTIKTRKDFIDYFYVYKVLYNL